MNDLEKSRGEIDAIDREMAALFEKRMAVCGDIAEYKKSHGLPIVDKTREADIIARHAEQISSPVHREYYTQFLRSIMRVSCDYQARLLNGMRVAYTGAEGAFGHIAAKKLFPQAALTAFGDFAGAYHAVENGEFDCAVLPIENSYAGDIGIVMDLMFSGSLYVNQVIELDVTHSLLAKEGVPMERIKTVVSHPQALEQCEEYIRAHGFETMEYSNTALAAKFVREQSDESIAAIASEETAGIFGLHVLERGINTARSNTTRFAVFSRAQNLPSRGTATGREHFILVFTTKNEAGALAQALNIIGAHDFNMRNLRSRPMKELLWSYYFFVEAEGNISTRNGQDMLTELSAVCARVKLVGTYDGQIGETNK